MKRLFTLLCLSLLTLSIYAKDFQTMVLTTKPQMSCQNCEKKIKTNIRFVKGTKSIETVLKDQHVIITFDAEKATVDDYIKAFAKIGYKVEVVQQPKPAAPDAKTGATPKK